MKLFVLVVVFVAASACTGKHEHATVYAFATPDHQRMWDLWNWFQKAVTHARIPADALSIHHSQFKEQYGVQVKICLENGNADKTFRCELRRMAAETDTGLIYKLGHFAQDTFTYNVLLPQPLDMGVGHTKVQGSKWETLLRPMTHEGGVDDLSCEAV